MNSDIFGFYQVSNYKTYSKLEAIDYKNVYGGNIHWNFNDELFSSVDWTNEPQSSLWDLYKQRVKQIREKYDYVVILCSGGGDSTNVVYSFLRNGIKVDEIIASAPISGLNQFKVQNKDNSADNTMSETYLTQLPLMNEISQEFPFRLHSGLP